MDIEADVLIKDLPTQLPTVANPLRGYSNAYVCFNERTKEVEIWPTDGGWIGAKAENFSGDIAPFHG